MPGTLILPKVRKSDGKIVSTSIDTDMIKGVEPRNITINGKKYPGVKIYTDNGNTFYVLSAPTHVMAAKQVAASKQGMIAVNCLAQLPSYEKEVKQIMTLQKEMAALPSSSTED